MTLKTYEPADVEHLVQCAENEGDLYDQLMKMGAARVNCPDSTWAHVARAYVGRLRRERRYEGSASALTVNAFAARLRDLYWGKAEEAAAFAAEHKDA